MCRAGRKTLLTHSLNDCEDINRNVHGMQYFELTLKNTLYLMDGSGGPISMIWSKVWVGQSAVKIIKIR